jgi:glycosyltransferase involved in cell wall biosynthesis
MEGGVGAFTKELACALAEEGHFVAVITSQKARPEDMARSFMEPFPLIDTEFGQLFPHIHSWRWSENGRIAEAIERFEPDIVNIQYQAAAYNMRSPAINLLPWRLRGVVPAVVTFHDLRVPYLFPKAGKLRETMVHMMAQYARGVIATNPADFRALQQICERPEQVTQIPIGSNIKAAPYDAHLVQAVRQKLGLLPDDILLGYFGFVNDTKGADTVVEALAQLDGRYHLVFIGGQVGDSDAANNSAFANQLLDRIEALGLSRRVHWTGFLNDTAVSAHMYAADMMVMPYKDGASLRRGTLMAAMAHGRPLLTTFPVTPTPELRSGKNVFFTAADDPQVLAEDIRELAKNPALRHQLGQAAVQVSELFSWDKIAAETAVFFEKILRN